jgi:integrase
LQKDPITMTNIKDQFREARLRAILELEKEGTDAYLPANVWGFDLSAIDRADLQPPTKKGYQRELKALLDTGIDLFDLEALQKYAEGLKPTHRTRLKRALRLISLEYEQSVKGKATPENLPVVQALVMRLEAMRDGVKVYSSDGVKSHIWLSPSQVKEITGLCGDDLEGKRDWIILGLLLGAGLHRAEVIKITFEALQQQPMKGGKMHDVLKVTGNGAKDRFVPISSLLAEKLREWHGIVGGGRIARSYQRKKLGKSISSVAVHQIVRKYGTMIGIPQLKTDDLRRTYAQLAYNSGLTLTQINKLMGHVNLTTTQRFLDTTANLDDITGNFVPLIG